MARSHSILILGAVILVVSSHGCKTEQAHTRVAKTSGPTRYELSYPSWAIDTIHFPSIPDDNPMTVEGIALGRRLFYETALSQDGTVSCASCHIRTHAFSDPQRYSSGVDGEVGHRNAMALVNLAWNHFFFWDARAMSLELQALEPVKDHLEMLNAWPEVILRLKERG